MVIIIIMMIINSLLIEVGIKMDRCEILHILLFVNTIMVSYIFYSILRKSLLKAPMKKKCSKKLAKDFNEITKINSNKKDVNQETKIERWRR